MARHWIVLPIDRSSVDCFTADRLPLTLIIFLQWSTVVERFYCRSNVAEQFYRWSSVVERFTVDRTSLNSFTADRTSSNRFTRSTSAWARELTATRHIRDVSFAPDEWQYARRSCLPLINRNQLGIGVSPLMNGNMFGHGKFYLGKRPAYMRSRDSVFKFCHPKMRTIRPQKTTNVWHYSSRCSVRFQFLTLFSVYWSVVISLARITTLVRVVVV